ncbi:PaaI family thioesterase [Paraburkholderia sp. MM6662-R1]|uniref:PaaI family thioesterase n=1 Tax=Paraburkholderia sp. MM6662-R1 TaxID=2991066 RepID=UPI003D1B7034
MNVSALDKLQLIARGEVPRPDLYETLDIAVVGAEAGSVVLELRPSKRLTNPWGFVGGGAISAVLDTATAWACDTMCQAGTACTTVALSVNFLRAVRIDDHPMSAHATAVHRGSRMMVSEGRLIDSNGRLVATATSTCFVVAVDGQNR